MSFHLAAGVPENYTFVFKENRNSLHLNLGKRENHKKVNLLHLAQLHGGLGYTAKKKKKFYLIIL